MSENLSRPLAFGVYYATPEFKAIEQHACVCFADDMGLVATKGPASDSESELYAERFAAMPELYAVAARIVELAEQHQPIGRATIEMAQRALAKANGKQP